MPRWHRRRGHQPGPRILQITDESAALSLVAIGTGVTVVPETARHRCPAAVTLVPFPGLDVTVALDLVWRKEDAEHPLVARLVQAAAAMAADG